MPSIFYKVSLPKTWNKDTYKNFQNELIKLQDIKYKKFNTKLTPTKYEIIGIRVPTLKKIAQEISKTNYFDYLKLVEYKYFEETLIAGILLSYIKEYDVFIKYFNCFLKYIDNWATCDLCISKYKIICKNKNLFQIKIEELLNSNNPFYIRVAIVSLLEHYINDVTYIDYFYEVTNRVNNDNYYVKMAVAWFISYLFINYRTRTLEYIQDNNLDKFTQNKAISKIRESFRVCSLDKKIILKYKK